MVKVVKRRISNKTKKMINEIVDELVEMYPKYEEHIRSRAVGNEWLILHYKDEKGNIYRKRGEVFYKSFTRVLAATLYPVYMSSDDFRENIMLEIEEFIGGESDEVEFMYAETNI